MFMYNNIMVGIGHQTWCFVSEYSHHVTRMHKDGDKLFHIEHDVSEKQNSFSQAVESYWLNVMY